MAFVGSQGRDGEGFRLEGANIVEDFGRQGYRKIGCGAVDWLNPASDNGSVHWDLFQSLYFALNTWSLKVQPAWIDARLTETPDNQPRFVFLNVGVTHVPDWHEGVSWVRWPSPCVAFGGASCSAIESRRRQSACLQWVDHQLGPLLNRFSDGTILICTDHGDCSGKDGLWEHVISQAATFKVPYFCV